MANKNKTTRSMRDTNGFAHLAAILIVTVGLALVGTYMVVAGHANSGDPAAQRINPYTASCPGNSVKYSVPKGKTATTDARQRIFGQPYPNANTELTTFMGKEVRVNKKITSCLKAVEWDLNNIYKTKYDVKYIYGASQVDANNPTNYFHAYGGAVDINPPDNPYYPDCKTSCPHDMPANWVRAFKKHGFFWGGNFKDSKDYMHFEWHGQI